MLRTKAGAVVEPGVFRVELGHEGAVDLEGVEGEPVQVAERRVAGAEVVQVQLDPQLLQPVEQARDRLRALHEDALGDLELQGRGVDARLVEDPLEAPRGSPSARTGGPSS